jgi:DNA gyrase subunit A
LIAVDLAPGDRLIGVELTDGNRELMLFSDAGKVIRFHESAVRSMGRTARGVRGMMLKDGQQCVGLIVVSDDSPILTATKHGYGKRTALEEYRVTARGGQGVISIQVSDRNGKVIGALQAPEDSGIILLGDQGTLVHIPVSEVSEIGRNTAGVRLIKLPENESLCDLQLVASVSVGDVQEAVNEAEPEDV